MSTLTSDRLSGYDIQLSHGIAVLRELANVVRQGKYTGSIGAPSKLALIGFSYGSYITHFTITDTVSKIMGRRAARSRPAFGVSPSLGQVACV